ncbi:HOG (high osmolarity glycerol) pathway protein [Coemansia sp. RSA 720]|nr:HOG (high osmolarity glycerol) pathway protein [Coemansia sp. RSA 638]KAJ2125473.1 HOG (high osmolarity glycerol) pathway protein [Coemansia sp. RSA 720]KAJ2542787.1 HOG (high osmolarity glycerol) pathway protein [Coemansia sp. RSA 1853]
MPLDDKSKDSGLSSEVITRDFAYPPEDPRYEGKYVEVYPEDDTDDSNESDPWAAFESGGPTANIDDEDSGPGVGTILGMARALYDFEAENPTELGFSENDMLYITYKQCDGWLVGYKDDQVGLIPENYVQLLNQR